MRKQNGTCTLTWECNAGYSALYGEDGALIQADHDDNSITPAVLTECSEITVVIVDENHKDFWTNCSHDLEYGWDCEFAWPESFSETWIPAEVAS